MTPSPENWVYRLNEWNRPFGVTEDWDDFLASIGEEDISWHCPWLRLPAMTVNNMGSQEVFLAGLTSFTFLRQFGISQVVPPPSFDVLRLPPFIVHGLRSYGRAWEDRRTEPSDPDFVTTLPGRYRKWLRRDVKARMG
ncbi:hypothetical protein RHSIM_Rhsim03G0182200 [Rhododendron simsii]|uniref:Uncharacterized protein n=1 Tax=Rhododendron simsii TaxID=118357 RepID=A0A834H7G4_RHOSS|nr:hypothetical protein RHSIM_Rhsim03G0182200 [Rhododendron simsii]